MSFSCETWQVLASKDEFLTNRPEQPETWHLMAELDRHLLQPLEERYGVVTLTYGFAGRELVKAVEKRAAENDRIPNVTPAGDQHAGHELNTRGNRICKRDGFAVDLRVPGQSSLDVIDCVVENLPFDRIYFYDAARSASHQANACERRRLRQLTKAEKLQLGDATLVPRCEDVLPLPHKM